MKHLYAIFLLIIASIIVTLSVGGICMGVIFITRLVETWFNSGEAFSISDIIINLFMLISFILLITMSTRSIVLFYNIVIKRNKSKKRQYFDNINSNPSKE